MFDYAKRYRVTATGCLVAVLLTLASTANAQETDQAPSSEPAPILAPAVEPIVPRLIDRAIELLEATLAKNDDAEKTEREITDLKAQQDMAYWAMLMFWAAFAQAVVGAVGIYFIWHTIKLSQAATAAAIKAAQEAEKSVAIAEDTAKRELRAYVSITEATMGRPGSLHVSIDFKNAGQTPAYNLRAWYAWETGDDVKFDDRSAETAGSSRELGPSVEFTIDAPINFRTSDIRDGVMKRQIPFFIWGQLRYTDAFTTNRVTGFRMTLPRGDGVDLTTLALIACADGNGST